MAYHTTSGETSRLYASSNTCELVKAEAGDLVDVEIFIYYISREKSRWFFYTTLALALA